MRQSPSWLRIGLVFALPCLACRPASAQETAWSFQPPREDFLAASYEGRDFLSPSNHLGEDSAHQHHDPVHAIAPGIVRYADIASGYGRVVVIEHHLPDGSFVSSIYGHLCGHSGFPLIPEGAQVQAGDRIGFVGEDAENGDGREHTHLGIRKGAYDGIFCGYSRLPECPPERYHRPSEFIAARRGAMRVSSGLALFGAAPRPGGKATFVAEVRNDHHDAGEFEFRLRLRRGEEPPAFVPLPAQLLDSGERARFRLRQTVRRAATYEAVLEYRPPGVAAWSPIAGDEGASGTLVFAVRR